jgi:hypothetical protein
LFFKVNLIVYDISLPSNTVNKKVNLKVDLKLKNPLPSKPLENLENIAVNQNKSEALLKLKEILSKPLENQEFTLKTQTKTPYNFKTLSVNLKFYKIIVGKTLVNLKKTLKLNLKTTVNRFKNKGGLQC